MEDKDQVLQEAIHYLQKAEHTLRMLSSEKKFNTASGHRLMSDQDQSELTTEEFKTMSYMLGKAFKFGGND